MDRIEDKNERMKRLSQERASMIETREQVKKKMQREKEKALAEFEKRKKKLKVLT